MAYNHEQAFEGFRKCTNRDEVFLDHFFLRAEELALGEATSCISVGPACGTLDVLLLQKVMTKCKCYYGVEPDNGMADALEKNMKACEDVQPRIIRDSAENWDGPQKKVDVVLMFDMLHNFVGNERARSFLKKCLSWLAPGGKMFIVMGSENRSMKRAAELFGRSRSSLFYEHSDLISDLKKMKLQSDQDIVVTDVNLKEQSKPVADYYFHKDTEEEEVTALFEYLHESYPSNTEKLVYWINVITTKK